MKAVVWCGKNNVRVATVSEPGILAPRDAIVRVTMTAICGSDLHLFGGFIPTMMKGDILGHEFMGEVVEVGPGVANLQPGDRVVVPFPIACGSCFFCRRELWSVCDNSNPNAWMAEKLFGYSPAGIFGYSHMLGGYAGGQAEYVRVPFADVGPLKVPADLPDEKVLFLTDIFPTGYMAAEQCGIREGDAVAVWGCGPVGLFAIKRAQLLGAEKVIAMVRYPERLMKAAEWGAQPLNYAEENVIESLHDMTGGLGPDACIDAVGMEAHGRGMWGLYDRAKQATMLQSDSGYVLRQCIQACRKGGTVSLAGVYGGVVDKLPMGAAFNKGLTFKMGQTHVHRYLKPLLERIQRGEIDPSHVISHRGRLEDAPHFYEIFRDKQEECIKVVLQP